MQPRCVQWCEINGRKYHVVGGIVSHAVVNPTFDPIAKAGAMHDYFRGNPDKLQPYEFLREREPIPAEYRDRDARIAKLDEFGLEAVWLFPTLGILYEELLKHDIDAVTHDCSPRSTAGSTTTGASTTRTASSRRRTSRSPISTGRSASSSGRSTTAPARRDAPGRTAHRRRARSR